ncbi:hypothetical protein IU470_13350 [Nocardia abscessus]|uniref:Uncharacterized protein n=1 Tax=Nocardia abscessus TaxID=120957 RepID=A0ABS0C982_9NOCA|nr:hypothetical protein [Nocardia abscessus]MBF6226082.1 hypothetical protein [Nocardia abscessus]
MARLADESGQATVAAGRARCIYRWIVERNGGVLERILDTELGPARRYWIDTADHVAVDGQPDHWPVVSPAGEHGVDVAAGNDR